VAAIALSSAGCYSAGQQSLELELEVAGTAPRTVALDGGLQLLLSRADLVFGPLTLCPGQEAGALCSVARMEWRQAALVDVLDPSRHRVARLEGQTGWVHSYMYDLGVVSLLGEPGSTWVSPEVDRQGASLVLEGKAVRGATELPFRAALWLATQKDNEQGVPLVRKSSSEPFGHELTASDRALVVTFDSSSWLTGLEASDFEQDEACSAARPVTCRGAIETRCDANGNETERRDCAALGRLCAPNQGCAALVEFSDGTAAQQSIEQAVVAGVRPRFEFR
jgi:hypothetical protein